MRKIYLTELEKDQLDPTGNCRNLITRVPMVDTWEPLPKHIVDGEAFLEVIKKRVTTLPASHKPYVDYSKEMFSKLGRQGGMFNRRSWEEKILAYFDHPQVTIDPRLYVGRDLFLREIKEIMSRGYIPQLITPSIVPTFGGLPSGLRKGTFAAESLERNQIGCQKFLPTIPGQRRMRAKDRVIFMDATVNVRAQEPYLTGMRYWLRENMPQYFGAWKRMDIVVKPGITRALEKRCAFANADYQSMDMNFTKQIAMELIYPVYELAYPDKRLTIGAHFEQNFEQPVYMGDYLLTGEHSLLSGANITNDFETVYSIILILSCCAELNAKPEFIAALGDDVTVAFKDVILAKRFLRLAMEISSNSGMIIHPDKSSVDVGHVTFCRQTYYLQGKKDSEGTLIGAYPSVLAVNNIVQPENLANSAGEALRSDLQRLDGLQGSPDATLVIQQYVAHSKSALMEVLSTDDWYACGEDWRDWWFRVYSEAWSPNSSWALHQIILNLPVSKEEKLHLLKRLGISG